MSDEMHQAMTQTPDNSISAKHLLWGVLAAAGTLAVLVTLLSILGGTGSEQATNTLQIIMLPIITGLMTVLVTKMTDVQKQVNGITHELINSRVSEAKLRATVEEREAGAARAAEVERDRAQQRDDGD